MKYKSRQRGRLKDKTKYEFIFENFLDKSFVLLTLKELQSCQKMLKNSSYK